MDLLAMSQLEAKQRWLSALELKIGKEISLAVAMTMPSKRNVITLRSGSMQALRE